MVTANIESLKPQGTLPKMLMLILAKVEFK